MNHEISGASQASFTTPLSVGIRNSGHIINTGGSSRHGQWYWMTVKMGVYIYI